MSSEEIGWLATYELSLSYPGATLKLVAVLELYPNKSRDCVLHIYGRP